MPIYTRIWDADDGDSLSNYFGQRIRLYGVNAPEWNQRDGWRATAILRALTFDRIAAVVVRAKDVYGRYVCDVWVNGLHINAIMRAMGYT
jgi:endonuclease YncB( thermonuclease family)